MHPFDHAISLTPTSSDRYAGAISAEYANMVGPFGDTTAATLLNAALLHPARLGYPIALTVNYASAVADGESEIEARPARTNRSTQHWMIELVRNGEVAATASAVFARRRETWSIPEAQAPSDLPTTQALERRVHGNGRSAPGARPPQDRRLRTPPGNTDSADAAPARRRTSVRRANPRLAQPSRATTAAHPRPSRSRASATAAARNRRR